MSYNPRSCSWPQGHNYPFYISLTVDFARKGVYYGGMTQIITLEFLVSILSLATAIALVNLPSEEAGEH